MWTLIVISISTLTAIETAQAQGTNSTKKDSVLTEQKKRKGLDAPIHYEAKDSIIFNSNDNKAYLFSNASVDMQNTSLKSKYIEISIARKLLFARGGKDSLGNYTNLPILKDGAEEYTADSMLYNSGSKQGKVYGLLLKQDEAFIQLRQVLKQSDGSFMGQNGKLTTCSDAHPHFYLNASKIKILPNNKVLFGAANLVFADIPTPLALPFGIAPLKRGRRNGLIMPNPGFNNANNSFFLSNLGYYQGLGKYADMQVTSDLFFNGDFRLGAQTHFVRRYQYQGSLALNMSRFGNGLDPANPEFTKSNDFSVQSQFNLDQKLLPGITLNGNINIVTGNFNKRNSRDIQSLSRNEFISGINFGRTFLNNKVNLSVSARHSQNTQTRDFHLDLPSLNMGVSSLTPFSKKAGTNTKWYEQLRITYNLNVNNSLSTKDTLLFSEKFRTTLGAIKTGIRHSIPISTNIKLFNGALNISPSANYQEIWYFKAATQTYNSLLKKVEYADTNGFFRLNSYSLSSGFSTNIYGTYSNLKLGKLRAIRHTLTPTIGLGYRPEINAVRKGWSSSYIDSNGKKIEYGLFSKNIYGSMGQEKSGSIGFNLSNNLQSKRVVSADSLGKEKLEKQNLIDQLTLSTNYNITADSFNWSDVTLGFNTVILKQVRIGMNANYSLYGYRNGKAIHSFSALDGGPILRYRSLDASLNSRFTPEMFGGKKSQDQVSNRLSNPLATDVDELNQVQSQPWNYYDFSIPWSININYNISYNAETISRMQRINNHRISVNGDIGITSEWKISYQTGYDVKRKEMASSEFSVARNLHCWQLEFHWIPSGYGKQWMFTLRPKSSLLQDLKLNKRIFSNPVLMQ